MEALLDAIAASDLARSLRFSRWTYAGVNAAHILGIAMLVGAVIPLDLRLLGVWSRVPLNDLVRVLSPVAGFGLLLALTTGSLLFATRANEYAALTVLQTKLALISIGATSALGLHAAYGLRFEAATRTRRTLAAVISLTCWLGALIAGRLIAFAG